MCPPKILIQHDSICYGVAKSQVQLNINSNMVKVNMREEIIW